MKHYTLLRISLVSLFFLSIASCVNDLKKIDEIASQKDLGVETGKNVEVLVSNNGEPRVKIIATETKGIWKEHHTRSFQEGLRPIPII